jgi:hypothetical protein
MEGVVAMAAGEKHNLLVKKDGTLWAMGENLYGQLGVGATGSQSTLVQVNNGTDVVAVAAGRSHSLFIKRDGTLWAMGRNNYGQLGIGVDDTTDRNIPVQVAKDVVSVTAGGEHSLYIDRHGLLWAMGRNNKGQLGIEDGDATDRHVPTYVFDDVVAVAAGSEHSLFVTTDYGVEGGFAKPQGRLWAMGYNGKGQLGLGDDKDRSEPRPVPGGDVVAVAAGSEHSLFIKRDRTLWAMGANDDNQLGVLNAAKHEETPKQVSNGNFVEGVAAGRSHSLFIGLDGTLWSMGKLGFNQKEGTTKVFADEDQLHPLISAWLPAMSTADRALVLSKRVFQAPATRLDIVSDVLDTRLDRQTGMFYQSLIVSNSTEIVANGFRLWVNNLPATTQCMSATGTNLAGVPYIKFSNVLAPNQTIALTLAYYDSARTAPVGVSVRAELFTVAPPPPSVGDELAIRRAYMRPDDRFAVEFDTLAGRTYVVQYSDDLQSWKQAQPVVLGTGGRLIWVDSGPPRTESLSTARHYRLLLLSQ